MRFRETMDSLVLVHFLVPAARVRPHLPAGLALESYALGGEELAFVALVCYRAVGFRPALLGSSARLGLGVTGINYRTYVRDATGPAVFFFAVTAAQALPVVGSTLLGARIFHAPATFDDAWDAGRLRMWSPHPWPALLDAQEADALPDHLAPFNTPAELLRALTDPLAGYVRGTYGGLGRMEVAHPQLTQARFGHVTRVRAGLFEQLGILRGNEQHHSLVVTRGVPFELWLGRGLRR